MSDSWTRTSQEHECGWWRRPTSASQSRIHPHASTRGCLCARRANHDAGYVSEVASCSLNAGQGIILAAGVTAVLTLGIVSCAAGTMTVGDLVMANALMLQLWAPLQFLGWFYRELR